MVHRADLSEDVVGTGYRSQIFYASDRRGDHLRRRSGHWPSKVVTRVSEAGRFWEEAPGQQDYFHRFQVGCPAPFPRQGEPATAF